MKHASLIYHPYIPVVHLLCIYPSPMSNQCSACCLKVKFKEETYLVFGPSFPDSYGICYNPGAKKLMFGVTTINSNPTTNTGRFASYLQRSLDDMQLLVSTAKL
jgi:hypothetical protein